MSNLLEIKEVIKKFYAKYDVYVLPVLKFLLALVVLLGIKGRLGYMPSLNSIAIILIVSLLCSFLPVGFMIFFAAVFVLLHCYSLAMEAALVVACLFILMLLLFFRFSPKESVCVLLTPICFALHIPYVMPIATGLVKEPHSIISVIFGTIVYYFLQGIKNNASLLSDTSVDGEDVNKLQVTFNQLFANKELYLMLTTVILAMIVVYHVRRMAIDHAWRIAIGAGVLTQFVILTAGYLIMGIKGKFLWLIVGSVLSWLISMLLEFLFFNLDYNRTERVQFEDDEYYYYVKAVPKVNLSSSEKKVQKIAGTEKED